MTPAAEARWARREPTGRSGDAPTQAQAHARAPSSVPLLWRIFLIDAVVLLGASLVLLATPVTVSSPVRIHEAITVVAGLCIMLIVTLLLLRRAFAPLERLADSMQAVDLLRPGTRAETDGPDAEVNLLAESFNDMLQRLEDERRLSSARAVAAQEDERRRVARELHDHVGQVLTGVLLQADQAVRQSPPAAQPVLEDMRGAVREAVEDVRRIARELRPEPLDDLGLARSLNALAATMSRQAGMPIRRHFDEHLPALDPQRELAVYRVAQESLTNLVRHAGADEATLELRADGDTVVLRVCDDGIGLPPSAGGGVSGGLRGMRERAVAVGAELTLAGRRPRGTVVELRVPALDR